MALAPPTQDANNAPPGDSCPPLPAHPDMAASIISDFCGTFNTQTSTGAIGCDRCEIWFHPSMSLDLPDQVVDNIVGYDGQGIGFICTECRSKSGKAGSVPDSAFKQLFIPNSKETLPNGSDSFCQEVRLQQQCAEWSDRSPPPRPWTSLTSTLKQSFR